MRRLICLTWGMTIILSACSVPLGAYSAEIHQAIWQHQHIDHYRFDVDIVCLCAFQPEPLDGPITIEVQDGVVVSAVYVEGTDLMPYLDQYEEATTIDSLFSLIERARSEEADEIDVTYDWMYGYPKSIFIDYEADMFDDETSYMIKAFQPLP
jgi:uncharacterized protein DUF6174